MAGHQRVGVSRSWDYDGGEILADGVVHGLGLILALAGSVLLIGWWLAAADGPNIASHLVYCLTLLVTLTVSAAYNMWPVTPFKWALRRVDHAMIFGLIAGTYTPFLVRADRMETTILLVVIWSISVAGMALKVLNIDHREWVSTALYVALGWSGLIVLGIISSTMPAASLVLIFVGGVLYSGGVAFHHWRSLRFQNAIWHGFVLLGALSHFLAVAIAVHG